MNSHFSKLRWPAFVVLAAALMFLLVVRRSGNLCFYALLLLALATAVRGVPGDPTFREMLKKYWPLHLAMAGPLIAIFISQLVRLDFVNRTYDYPSRMGFFFALLWVALLLSYRQTRHLQWACVVGAILSAVKMYVITNGGTTRGYVDFMPIIEFAQMALLLGAFSILALAYRSGNSMLDRIGIFLKVAAGCAGLYAAYLSQTRGAWLSIPVFIVVVVAVLGKHIHWRRQAAAFALLLVVVTAMFGATDLVRTRVSQAEQQLLGYFEQQNVDTSVGVRLQLWKGSWLLFTEHPLVGVGRERFSDALGDLERRGIITHAARVQPHSHNEILYNMATLGTIGLFGILGLYLVPAFYFWRRTRHEDREIRATAGMGLVLCIGFFIGGLTDVMLMWGVSDNFYAILAAILFASVIRREQMLATQQTRPASVAAASD